MLYRRSSDWEGPGALCSALGACPVVLSMLPRGGSSEPLFRGLLRTPMAVHGGPGRPLNLSA